MSQPNAKVKKLTVRQILPSARLPRPFLDMTPSALCKAVRAADMSRQSTIKRRHREASVGELRAVWQKVNELLATAEESAVGKKRDLEEQESGPRKRTRGAQAAASKYEREDQQEIFRDPKDFEIRQKELNDQFHKRQREMHKRLCAKIQEKKAEKKVRENMDMWQRTLQELGSDEEYIQDFLGRLQADLSLTDNARLGDDEEDLCDDEDDGDETSWLDSNEAPHVISSDEEETMGDTIAAKLNFWSKRPDRLRPTIKANIKDLAKTVPSLLYHVHSYKGKRHTTGEATEEHVAPAAHVEDKQLYDSIYDFPLLSELIRNLAYRILWMITKTDQFTSYTTSPLFAFVHALGRKQRGETDIYISVIDTRTARTKDGKPAEFYYVPDLKSILQVGDLVGWGRSQFAKLSSPWYTHEYVAHGVVELDHDAFRRVPFQDFIDKGLFDFAPRLYSAAEKDEMKKLYHRCLQLRLYWFGQNVQRKHFEIEYLNQAADLAKLFNSEQKHGINLQIFLDLVGLSKRQRHDELFLEYLRDNFEASDLDQIMSHPHIKKVPCNLPESISTLDRIRDACDALDVPTIEKNSVQLVDHFFTFQGEWQGKLANITAPKKRNDKSAEQQDASEDADDMIDDETGSAQAISVPNHNDGPVHGGALGLGIGTATVSSQDAPSSSRQANATHTVVEQATADA